MTLATILRQPLAHTFLEHTLLCDSSPHLKSSRPTYDELALIRWMKATRTTQIIR